jgi:hypothetical protein
MKKLILFTVFLLLTSSNFVSQKVGGIVVKADQPVLCK